ncbi:DUF4347 domain-containing protein [Microcoleus sp. Pol7_B2]|uniref:DUF4347 domain-containing protein n=1 Tax=Microcoleus sp. Pol7_B2 TaxID=2818895 RepID=UPI002FCFF06F
MKPLLNTSKTINPTTTIVFIDAGVENSQQLIEGVIPSAEIFVLDKTADGIEQISEVLQQRQNIDAVHIISHGSPGCLYLGNSQLSLDNLIHYAPQLQQWNVTNLLLYGCNVAAGDAGEEFIAKLHTLTGAEIAASKTLTGSAAKGGNWELEVTTGQAELTPAFSPEVMATYPGVMNGTSNNDILRGTASNDFFAGLAGSDVLYGYAGYDYLEGGDGDDIGYGGNDDDQLLGGNGSDRLYGDVGHDVLYGQEGNDILYGGDGNDALIGDAGSDRLYGDAGNDAFYGDAGDDILYGGDGDDYLNGGEGSDRLYGNGGNNTFVLELGMGQDLIYGFQDGVDMIQLYGLTFGELQIAQSGTSTLIKIASSKVTLASLVNTNSALIGVEDFIVIASPSGEQF